MTVRLYTTDDSVLTQLVNAGFTLRDDPDKSGFPYVELSRGEPTPDVLAPVVQYLNSGSYSLTARFQRDLNPTKEESLEFETGQWIAVRKVKFGFEEKDTYEFTISATSVDSMNQGYQIACQHS